MSKDMLNLDSQLCFPLYACSREVIKRYTPFLDEIGLTYTQYIAMMVFWEQKTTSVKSLGARLFLDSGTLTPLLKKMEAQGLVIRERSAADQRSVLVTITSKGEELKEKALTIPGKVGACINLNAEDASTLYRLLYQVLGRI